MKRILLLTALCAVSSSVQARQSTAPDRTPLPRLTGEIRVDGRVDEAAWEMIPVLPLIQFSPTWGGPVYHETEIRIAYDDEFIYLSARCMDTQPPTVTTYRRDNWSGRDDQIGIAIDSFNDYGNALAFVLYATGTRIDAQFSDDARTFGSMNSNWNTFWDGEVSRSDTGWEVELRIPWSSLRFETPDEGPVIMGISAYRYRADGDYFYQYPGNRNDWGFFSFVKPSKGARHTMEGIRSSKPLYITPYLTGGLGQDFELNADETAYERSDNPTFDVGLDLKYSLTSNLTLDATFNTDFAQVEADDQQVNLTRFSLFFPEKRSFFLERTSNFDFSFGGFDRVFHSRRIGLSGGQQIRLLGGGRLVGRVGDWDVGVLTIQSGRDKGLASENFGTLRLKRRVLNANSYLGGIATSRVDERGTYNVAYGLDGVINLRKDDFLRFNWAQTFETDQENQLTSLDNTRFRIQLERPRSTGLRYGVSVNRSGRRYRPGVGFQLRNDYTQFSGGSGYGWQSESETRVQSWSIDGSVDAFYENGRDHFGTVSADVGGNMRFRSQYAINARAFLEWENLNEGFSLSDDADIPKDEYTYAFAQIGGETPGGRPLQANGNLRIGQFFDGTQFVASVTPNWSISERFALSGTYEFNRIRFADRDQAFDAHVIRSRTDLMLNTRITFSAFLQYNSAADAVILNARFRYNPREGNDFFLVYNEAVNTDRFAVMPELPFSSSRTLIAKYTYTFLR